MVLLADTVDEYVVRLVQTDIVGALVTSLRPNKTVLVEKGPKGGAPGNRLVIDSMSFGWLALENSGERLKRALVGLLLW